jgi:hypothetical protein
MTFNEWFHSEQGNDYEGQWSFAKAAWEAADRAARTECEDIAIGLAGLDGTALQVADAIKETIK